MLKKFMVLGAVAAFVLALTGASASWEKGAVILPMEPDDEVLVADQPYL